MPIERTHINPGGVTKRLERIIQVQQNNEVQKAIAQELDARSEMIRKSSPVKTGYMRSTIGRRSAQGLEEIHVTAYYARYVDQGIEGRRRQPFFSSNIAGLAADLAILVRGLYGVI